MPEVSRKFSLGEFSVEHPKLVVVLSVLITLLFATQFPKIKTDTNPKHMLPATSDVRVWNNKVEKTFGLYKDVIVVGTWISSQRGSPTSILSGTMKCSGTW